MQWTLVETSITHVDCQPLPKTVLPLTHQAYFMNKKYHRGPRPDMWVARPCKKRLTLLNTKQRNSYKSQITQYLRCSDLKNATYVMLQQSVFNNIF